MSLTKTKALFNIVFVSLLLTRLAYQKLVHLFYPCKFWEIFSVYKVHPKKGENCIHGGSDSKESACSAGDLGSIPGSGRSPGEENGYPLQYSCLGNPMDRGAWQAKVHGMAKSQTRLRD